MLTQSTKFSDIKSNCVNTLYKFYNPSIETVEKLNFYNPDILKDSFYYDKNNSNKNFSTDKKNESSIMNNLSIK